MKRGHKGRCGSPELQQAQYRRFVCFFSRGNPEFVGQKLTGVMRACGPQTKARNEAITARSLESSDFMASFLPRAGSKLSFVQVFWSSKLKKPQTYKLRNFKQADHNRTPELWTRPQLRGMRCAPRVNWQACGLLLLLQRQRTLRQRDLLPPPRCGLPPLGDGALLPPLHRCWQQPLRDCSHTSGGWGRH